MNHGGRADGGAGGQAVVSPPRTPSPEHHIMLRKTGDPSSLLGQLEGLLLGIRGFVQPCAPQLIAPEFGSWCPACSACASQDGELLVFNTQTLSADSCFTKKMSCLCHLQHARLQINYRNL